MFPIGNKNSACQCPEVWFTDVGWVLGLAAAELEAWVLHNLLGCLGSGGWCKGKCSHESFGCINSPIIQGPSSVTRVMSNRPKASKTLKIT